MRSAYSSNAYLNFSIEETIARIAGLGYAGLELLADVPHAWPAGLLAERKQAIRRCLEQHGLAIANVNAFMMNAVADPRQPYWHPSWIEPDRALSGHSPRAHEANSAAGQGTRRPVDPDGAGRAARARRVVAPGRRRLLRRDHALRRVGRAVGRVSADRARAGPDDRDVRAISGVRRADRLAAGWG